MYKVDLLIFFKLKQQFDDFLVRDLRAKSSITKTTTYKSYLKRIDRLKFVNDKHVKFTESYLHGIYYNIINMYYEYITRKVIIKTNKNLATELINIADYTFTFEQIDRNIWYITNICPPEICEKEYRLLEPNNIEMLNSWMEEMVLKYV